MKICAYFDSSAAGYEIDDELGRLRSVDGVESVALFRKTAGEGPIYSLEITVAEGQADAVSARLGSMQDQFSGYISNTSLRTYAPA